MGDKKMSWRDLVSKEMSKYDECWDDATRGNIVKNYYEWEDPGRPENLNSPKWLERFTCGLGGGSKYAVTVWTKNRVYFSAVYDGATWCASAPVNPCDETLPQIGQ